MRAPAALVLTGILVASAVGGANPHTEPWLWGHRKTFGPWSRPVDLGPVLNSTAHEQTPAISRDGLSLYFASTRQGSEGFDLWVSQRLAIDLPWETPVNLGPTINTPANENGPSLSPDGRFLFFVSNRPGGAGLADLYMSRRIRSSGGYTWDAPVPLSSLNTSGIDAAPNYFANEHGRPQLYFTTTRLGGPEDIHVSELQKNGEWGTPVPVVELNSHEPDGRSTIRSDGLEIIFDSSRDLAAQTDLYSASRDHVWQPWSIPEKVAGAVNTDGFDARPSLSHDGRTLYFTFQTAEGHLDLLVSTRGVLGERPGKH
jgi:Tol biopolymer transport system component